MRSRTVKDKVEVMPSDRVKVMTHPKADDSVLLIKVYTYTKIMPFIYQPIVTICLTGIHSYLNIFLIFLYIHTVCLLHIHVCINMNLSYVLFPFIILLLE